MGKIKNVEIVVMQVLEEREEARADDHVLCCCVYEKFNVYMSNFAMYFLNHNLYGLPAFETISRARRKLQAEYPDLRPKAKVIEARTEKEKEFRAYAREDVSKRKEIC